MKKLQFALSLAMAFITGLATVSAAFTPSSIRGVSTFIFLITFGASLLMVKQTFMELRTPQQNRYLHLLLGYVAMHYGCTITEAKENFYKRAANKALFEMQDGELRSTKELTRDEMSESIDRFRIWAAKHVGIYLPTENEKSLLSAVKKEVLRNDYWLANRV